MALKVIDHVPSIEATGVFRNETIKVYFNKPIEPSSYTWDTLSVNDKNTYSTVVGELGVLWSTEIPSGVCSGISFLPSTNLLPNTEYSVYVFGVPTSIIAKDGDQLPETYSFNFVTGTGYYTATGDAGVPSGDYDYTIDINSGYYNLENGLSVLLTNPKNQESDVPTNSGQIDIYFNIPLATPVSDLSGFINVKIDDVLN